MNCNQFIIFVGLLANLQLAVSSDASVETTDIQKIDIYLKFLKDNSVESLGTLNYDKSKKRGLFERSDIEIPPNSVDLCIGTSDLKDHDCFTYLKGGKGIDFNSKAWHIFLDEANEIKRLAVNNEDANENVSTPVVVHSYQRAPVPNLNPDSRKNAPKKAQESGPRKEVVVQKKKVIVKDDDGNEVEKEIEEEVEVEVDDRSWVQKNWMYIVLPLVFFMLLGEEKKQEK
ncbi:uncharacterized protein RJT20DRAFT_64526 [Scheffersomyces xylosifermentans]|uniref:uncharacterized protein n=1 Tax=Scheffersomyces xylosifermentans TaxID=1304137 RepID=UPI00315D9E24